METVNLADTTASMNLDHCIMEQLKVVINSALQEFTSIPKHSDKQSMMILTESDEIEHEKVIRLPSSLSLSQVEGVLNLATHTSDIRIDIKWFFPVLNLVLSRKNTAKTAPTITSSQFSINVTFPRHLREAFNKLCLIRSKRTIISYPRLPCEPFQSNFNIVTYINTAPIAPTKFAPKAGAGSNTDNNSFSGSNAFFPQCMNEVFISETDQLLLEQFQNVNRIHLVSGMCKVDKLNLTLLLNNEAFMDQKPCRIIYLQSMSILTFWMALKVKELCGDYHWNSSGYQITLESKSSPNNNIIFFELSTFLRALTLNMDTSLVTHLIVDIDHHHFFFNLFLLYIKTNFDKLRHMRLIIFTRDHSQARTLYDYFAPEVVSIFDWTDFQTNILPENLGPNVNSEPVNIVHLYLEDIAHHLTVFNNDRQADRNLELESLLPSIVQSDSSLAPMSISMLVEFVRTFPVLLNYQCHALNGLTPLIVAIVRGTVDQVYHILSAGANVHLTSWNGMSPVEWAIWVKHEQIFHLLLTHLASTVQSFDLNLVQHYSNKFMAAVIKGNEDINLDTKMRQTPIVKGNQSLPLYEIDYSVIMRLLLGIIRQLNQSAIAGHPLGIVLVLLPSYNVISTLRKQIIASLAPVTEYSFTTFCLYPHLPNNELDIAVSLLNSVSDTQVRVVLSTFTLDCLLLTDIRFVINTGVQLAKVQSGFTTGVCSRFVLLPNQSSEKTAEFGHYRDLFHTTTGQPVYIYNLYSRNDVLNHTSQLDTCFQPESICLTLDHHESQSIFQCICASKSFKWHCDDDRVEHIFAQMASAPSKLVIDNSVHFLKSLNMFDENERFTEMGRVLVDLSIDPQYAKMIIFSVLLRCLDPILTIVCALSSPDCFEITSTNCEQRWQEMQSLYELSHRSHSDHLTFIYAFQKWQDLCRNNPKNVAFDRSGIILFSSFELIYSLRTKVLGQLRACGFVKGKGSMNIRQLNINSDNFTLVKAAICSGQSLTNLAVVRRDILPRLLHFDQATQPLTYLHPNSVLSHHLVSSHTLQNVPTGIVMFDKKITSGQVSYLCQCTLVSPLTVAVFANETHREHISLCEKDQCIRLGSGPGALRLTGEDVDRCFELRTKWQHFARRRIVHMHSTVTDDENQLISELIRFCTLNDQCEGFESHPAIGRAPQVMSTYFCSTKMITVANSMSPDK